MEKSGIELSDSPSAFAAGDGEELWSSEIDTICKNVEKIHRQLRNADEEQTKKWALPRFGEGKRSAGRARKVITDVVNGRAICEKRRRVPERP